MSNVELSGVSYSADACSDVGNGNSGVVLHPRAKVFSRKEVRVPSRMFMFAHVFESCKRTKN